MNLEGKKIGFGVTGSHCTFEDVFPQLDTLMNAGADVIPVVSYEVQNTDTRFGKAEDHLSRIEKTTGNRAIKTIEDAEPLGPNPLDGMVVAPLTGNSLGKLANSIIDTPVLMAVKATIRNQTPVVLAIATNDALGLNGINLMRLMATKHYFFVPYGQDDPYNKSNSLVSDMNLIENTLESALNNQQLQPVIIPHLDDNMIE